MAIRFETKTDDVPPARKAAAPKASAEEVAPDRPALPFAKPVRPEKKGRKSR